MMNNSWLVCLITALAAGTLGMLIGWYIGRRRTHRQIRRLTLSLDSIMRGEYTVDFSPFREGDFSILAGQLELVVRRTENMVEQLGKDKTDLKESIADISHQLKTPLTALTTYLELLETSEPDNKRRSQITRCIQLADKMNELTHTLLDMARLDAGTVHMQFQPHFLTDTLQSVIRTVQNGHPEQPDAITLHVPPALTARYDEKWLSQALVNLLNNACNHAGNPPLITVSAEQKGSMICITVQDNGQGIDPQDMPHIFERFYRAKNNRSGGLGIGLSMAESIVRLHHGHLRAVCQNNETTFILTLPQLPCMDKTQE